MNIETGQTTEWLMPDDAEIIRDTLSDEMGYVLDAGEVFVLARSEEEFAEFHATYMAGVRALDRSSDSRAAALEAE